MKTLTYQLRLLEPALVTALEGDPNSAVAFNYIPGSVIRGAMIRLFLHKNSLSELDMADEVIRRMFFSDEVLYLNAYPALNGQRALPVPASWHAEKGTKTPIYDLARDAGAPKNPKSVEGFAIVNAQAEVERAKVDRFIAIHTQRDRRKGRSTSDSGNVYQYDALAAGQIFAAAILCQNDEDADLLYEYLRETEIRIGGARSAGYGRARLETVAIVDDWTEGPSFFEDGGPLVITLLSDAILRNEIGEYETNVNALKAAIARRLGVESKDLGEAQAGKIYLGSTLVGGFNRKWGLPLPQTAALSMGSTIVFTDHRLNRAQVDWLMRWGIGERRAEGFGRIGVNLYEHSEYVLKQDEKLKSEQTDGRSEEVPQAYTRLPAEIARRELHRRLGLALRAQANGITFSRPPKPSQVNALRAVIQNALRKTPVEASAVRDTLEHIDQRRVSRQQFENFRVQDKPFKNWATSLLTAAGQWQQSSDVPIIQALLVASKANEENENLHYNLRLIDAVLARAAKSKESSNE